MLESVTVDGPFSIAAIARACRNTLAGVVEPDGRRHGAQLSAARRCESRRWERAPGRGAPDATRRALLDSRPACKEGFYMDPARSFHALYRLAPDSQTVAGSTDFDPALVSCFVHERPGVRATLVHWQ